MISREFSVAVVASDPKKSAKWFSDVLGFESSANGHWVVVHPKGSRTKIHLCEGTPEPGNTGIAFYAEDISELAAGMKSRGAKFTQDVKKESWGTYAMFADPDGNEYWLRQSSGP